MKNNLRTMRFRILEPSVRLVLYFEVCMSARWYFNFPKEQYCNVTWEERSVESSNCREKQQQVLLLICLFSHTVHSNTHWYNTTFLFETNIYFPKVRGSKAFLNAWFSNCFYAWFSNCYDFLGTQLLNNKLSKPLSARSKAIFRTKNAVL